MRILHLLAPAPTGGLESVVATLASAQHRAGHEVHVATLEQEHSEEPALLAALRNAGVPATRIYVRRRSYRRERAEFAALCRRVRPTVVHSHGCRPDVVHSGIAASLGIARVSTVHGLTNDTDLKGRIYHWLQRRALRGYEGVIVVSRPLVGTFLRRGIEADRLHLVPNAFEAPAPPLSRREARATLGIPNDRFVLGWVGRLGREKGADVLLDALPAMPNDTFVALVGDGPERTALRQQAEALAVSPRISWCGSMPNAGRLMRAFDALVLSSRTEGTPMVLFEAMSAGVPIVATSVGGVPDVVGRGEALLLAPEDPVALAAAVHELRANPALAQARAAAAMRRVSAEYRVEPWLTLHDAVYASAVSAGVGPAR